MTIIIENKKEGCYYVKTIRGRKQYMFTVKEIKQQYYRIEKDGDLLFNIRASSYEKVFNFLGRIDFDGAEKKYKSYWEFF